VNTYLFTKIYILMNDDVPVSQKFFFSPINVDFNPICHLLALFGTHHILHVSRVRVKICICLYRIYFYFN